MATAESAGLVGRETELARARDWVARLREGPSALLVGGEPGIGKTTVWSASVDEARIAGALVLVTRPVEAELPLGHAALGDLFAAVVPEVLDELSPPLADALGAALLVRDRPEPADPHAVGRAVLAALRALAARGPLVLAVDDVQWVDPSSARALSFAVRRLDDAPVGLALSLRDGHGEPLGTLGARIPVTEVSLAGLSLGATAHLLRGRVDADLSRLDAVRIHERSAGNPFFALELARGGSGLPGSVRELVEQRIADLDPDARAAVESAAVSAPLPVEAFPDMAGLDSAVTAGMLVESDGEIRFAHPLLATGAYELLPPGRRRELHAAAAARSPGLEERARHTALATAGTAAEAADLLEEAARSARARGATEAAVELAAHARRLTPSDDRDALARRTMDEADYLFLAADEPSARRLVDDVIASGVGGETRVRALVQRALHETEPQAAVARLEEAVAEPHEDVGLAARTYANLAWQRGAWLGDAERAVEDAAVAIELAERAGDESTLVTALTAAGLVGMIAGRHDADAQFERALEISERNPATPGDHTPRLAYAHLRYWGGDWARAEELLRAERERAEQDGDDGLLLRLDLLGADFELRRGRWDEAERMLDAALLEARDYWQVLALVRRALLRARRGDRRALEDAAAAAASPVSDPVLRAAAAYAAGLVDVAEGRAEQAADRLVAMTTVSDPAGSRGPEFAATIPESVAALLEAGRIADAELLTERLERRSVSLAPWGPAAVELCRGSLLVAAGESEAALARLAVARTAFEEIDAPWELGQTLLAQGNALRRLGRRREAGAALERAVTLFAALGAEPWRARSEDELRRARPRPRRDDSLTAAESRVAALVAAGHTNKEVAAQLFTTVATVEAHLTRIYRKLGLRSRTELARAVADGRVALGD
jgi:DNA-binding CsgD family transcriptional regulator